MSAVQGVPGIDFGTDRGSVTEAVRQASKEGPRRVARTIDFTSSSGIHRFASVLLGLYLTYYVSRVQEVFPVLAVPRLPMILMLLIAALTAAGMPSPMWRRIWDHSLAMRLMLLFIGLVILTVPMGIYVMGSYEFLRDRYMQSLVVFFAALILCRDRTNLRLALSTFVIVLAVLTIWGLMHPQPKLNEDGEMIFKEDGTPRMDRMGLGGSLDPNDFAAVVVAAIPMAIYLGIGGFLRRIIFWGVAMILVAGVVPTGSRGGMLGLMVVGIVLISQGSSWWRKVLLAGMVVAAAGLFVLTASEDAGARFGTISTADYNFTESEGRIAIWKRGLVWMTWRPWGYGIDNFPVFFGWMNGPDRAAHNSFVQIGVEIGVAGLATFCFLIWHLGRSSVRQRKEAAAIARTLPYGPQRRRADSEAWLAGCGTAMLAGTMTTGFFLSNAYYGLMYMVLGVAAAILLGYPVTAPQAATPGEAPAMIPNRVARPGRAAAGRR